MHDDNGVLGMTIHKWLGTGSVVLLIALVLWRAKIRREGSPPSLGYLLAAALVVAILVYQGTLGGNQVFSNM